MVVKAWARAGHASSMAISRDLAQPAHPATINVKSGAQTVDEDCAALRVPDHATTIVPHDSLNRQIDSAYRKTRKI